MEENISCDVAKEFLMVLSYCDNKFIEKIPKDLMIKINNLAADSNRDFYLKKDKSLSEQDLSNECKDLLSELYYMFVLDDRSREELLNEIFNNLNSL